MRTTLLCLALCASLSFIGAAHAQDAPAAAACKSTVSGDLHLHTVKSAIFGNERKARRALARPSHDPAR